MVEIENLEDLAFLLPKIIKEGEEKLKEAKKSPEILVKLLEEDPVFDIPSSSHYGHLESELVVRFGVMVGEDPKNLRNHFNILLACNLNKEGYLLPDLSKNYKVFKWAGKRGLYDTLISSFRKSLPMGMHGGGWKPSTCHSQFGRVIGRVAHFGGYERGSVEFKSKKFQEVEREVAKFQPKNYREVEENEGKLPLKFMIEPAIDSPTKSLEYFFLKFRAADMNWGDGEFVALVRHLGLGREKPEYTFESLKK
ncbi:MAG: hypothetical protein KAT77_04080 [Nanoarchaeota archaeon]|nr:hypothetical protein [Nanoarchaeota archaeon]